MIKRGEIVMFDQLVDSLESSLVEFEKAFEIKDGEYFNEIKKLMINIQKKISQISK